MHTSEVLTVIQESYILYSGTLVRKINSFYPGRKIVMGISFNDGLFRVWAIPVRYASPDPNINIIEHDFESIDDTVDYFMEFKRDSCKDTVDIKKIGKLTLKTYPQPNALD